MQDDDRHPPRLATYGSLSPGEVNHCELAALEGRWSKGTVRGVVVDGGWAAGLGFPGLILDPAAPPVEVQLFESADLPAHWSRLDEFEGSGYQRVLTMVTTSDSEVPAHVYVLASVADQSLALMLLKIPRAFQSYKRE